MKYTKAIFGIGNGRMFAGVQEGNWIQVFGPPYSSPNVFALSWEGDAWRQTERLSGAAVLRHTLACGEAVDFAAEGYTCLVRRVVCHAPLTMCLAPHPSLARGVDSMWLTEQDGAVCVSVKFFSGNDVYNRYPLPFEQHFVITVTGARSVTKEGHTLRIEMCGEAELRIVGGPSYPEVCDTADKLRFVPYDTLLEATRAAWTEKLAPLSRLSVPAALPRREELLRAAEDTAVCILTQQGEEGGVLAGTNYHMCYVRDQFGVCRGMLRCGLYEAAAAMLRFYGRVFAHSGKVLNAQACGVDGMFHFAENDAAEIPGYLLLQYFMYADVTGDTAMLDEHRTFLRWLYDVQVPQLGGGMMPFNGDETYIAGGILPRSVINDGSAEATLLFLMSGRRLSAWLGGDAQMDATLDAVERTYSDNFICDGVYYLNNPARRRLVSLPAYRYGVCLNVGNDPACEYFGWTRRGENDHYFCPHCTAVGAVLPRTEERFRVPSALLMPAWLGSELRLSAATDYLTQELAHFAQNGTLESPARTKLVGYDYGLLLYNACYYGRQGAAALYDTLLDLRDEAGVWSEYYQDDAPVGTRYRPWESAVNIDALLYYAQTEDMV